MVFDNYKFMIRILIAVIFSSIALGLNAQTQSIIVTDSLQTGKVTIIKDSRLNDLAKQEAAYNEALALAPKTAKGYRLMVLNSNNRNLSMQIRSQLLQRYPDEKLYMSFQSPYVKLKMGNFLSREDADNFRKDIIRNLGLTSNIYILNETIELKPEIENGSIK